MAKIDSLDKTRLPRHLAIIMDGNGRWAKSRGMLRIFGHENGAKSVREIVESCARLGIEYLTLYAFSTENWNRPKTEVSTLMRLLMNSLRNESRTLADNNIKLQAIGNLDMLPKNAKKELLEVIEMTQDNTRMTLTMALSYGSRDELIKAVQEIATKVQKDEIAIAEIDEKQIGQHLFTNNMPDVDLLIRTSGEHRISNFLLWQIAYAELYFTDVLWPDFREDDLAKAISEYQKRERRFGKTSEQIK
jgi:undecaprenyl diphosphate synthase